MSLLTERIRKDVEKKNRAARSVESVAGDGRSGNPDGIRTVQRRNL